MTPGRRRRAGNIPEGQPAIAGVNIRAPRQREGWSQARLGELTGWQSASTVCAAEGRRGGRQRGFTAREIKRGWHDCRVKPEEHAGPPEQRPAQHVRIVHLTAPVFRALVNGDLTAANAASPVPLSAYFAGPEWRAVWQRRSRQVEEDPASAGWVTGVIWDERHQVAVGRAGYHGPPDPSGMAEIGYAVDPAYRRRGYARAALEALLQRAAREPRVHTVRVSISPGNVASCRLASQYGFTEVGEQWDDEDGLEIVYELDAGRR